jgi:hypothetical protein
MPRDNQSLLSGVGMVRGFLAVVAAELRSLVKPGLVLQAVALLLLLLYYGVPASRAAFDTVADIKTAYGWRYAAVATALFGGLLPCVVLLLLGERSQRPWADMLFITLFWAYKGVEIDFFYTLQGVWFGTEPSFATIAKKTVVDQFGYSVFWAAPTTALAYLWKNVGYQARPFWQGVNRDLFLRQIPLMAFSNWLVWLPAVCIIYCLPMSLQLPMFNLVLCFWVLLVAFLTKTQHAK